MKDTLRLVIGWKCNLDCSYCCNKLPAMRKQFRVTELHRIKFERYPTLCLTGGEPLAMYERLLSVLITAKWHNPDTYVVLNTNGLLLSDRKARELERYGLNAINVGLHNPETFDVVIQRALAACGGTGIALRFNVWDKLAPDVARRWPSITVRPWEMNKCDRANEDRRALEAYPAQDGGEIA